MASASFSSQDDLPLVALNAASGGSKEKNGQKMRTDRKAGTSQGPRPESGRSKAGERGKSKVGSPGRSHLKLGPPQSPPEQKPKLEDMKAKKEEPTNHRTGPITPSKSRTVPVKTSPGLGSPNSTIPIKPKRVPRPKKEYDLPGQKKDTPAQNDPLRKFYTSLREQRPESQLAVKWCVEHGLEPREVAEAWVEELGSKKRQTYTGSSRPTIARKQIVKDARMDDTANPTKNRISLTGRGISAVRNESSRQIQKRAPKRKVHSPEGALPPKEMIRNSKGSNGSKSAAGKVKTSSAAVYKRKPNEGLQQASPPQKIISTQSKQEPSKQDVAPVGASWESSSEDEMPLSKRRLAA